MNRLDKRRSRWPVILCVAGGVLIFVVEMFSSWHMTQRRIERKNQEKARYQQEHYPAVSSTPESPRIKVYVPQGVSPNTARVIEEAAAP
ncbi:MULTISPECIES: hypothetical protein [unclassified Pseudomonas]|uniref:hypothetical protein n=1 Tax=unclassified Pseudomonas TaxID=196821 RepID=UPI0011AEC800|nr:MULTISPECIES: hypothetical protein [unclassified Pseudomonas]